MTIVPLSATDPIPAHAYPVLTPVAAPPPVMPQAWSATVLLHPFGPPPSEGPVPDTPYYEMRIATLDYAAGKYLSARVRGCLHGWWYVVTPAGTRLSIDGGTTWSALDCGWTLPGDWYGAAAATVACAGASPLNWLVTAPVEWWRLQVPLPAPSPPGATWLWFDAGTRLPVRMMFGVSPPSPAMGDPAQLAFFQQFSLSYFAEFTVHAVAPPLPTSFGEPAIAGLAEGNPGGYKPFVWNSNFGLTSFSTPVNGLFNPLATRTLYVWHDDVQYRTYTDRAQSTLMHYTYNPLQPAGTKPIETVTSLLTGIAPGPGVTYAGTGFLFTHYRDGSDGCISGPQFQFGQEPPWWLSIGGVGGTLVATITDHPVLAPGRVVTVYSVLFPPNDKYPDGVYLWTWYAPEPHGDGTASCPILFMQSDSGVGEGTSLALADYFYHANFAAPIDPANFTVPTVCASATAVATATAAAPAGG